MLLGGATAGDAATGAGAATGACGVACIGGTGGTAADSNDWNSPLGLHSPHNNVSTYITSTGSKSVQLV